MKTAEPGTPSPAQMCYNSRVLSMLVRFASGVLALTLVILAVACRGVEPAPTRRVEPGLAQTATPPPETAVSGTAEDAITTPTPTTGTNSGRPDSETATPTPLLEDNPQVEPVKVLFVGHSWLSNAADHINEMVEPAGDLWADSVIHGGYKLKNQWENERQHEKIVAALESEQFDYVVIVEHPHYAFTDREQYLHYATLLDELIRSYGAQTVLFLPWYYAPYTFMQKTLTENTYWVAGQIDALVAPVGEAWKTSLELRPDLQLHKDDGNHPTSLGIYLRDLVFYATIMQQPPTALSNLKLDDETAEHFKTVAWDTVVEWSDE